MKKVILAAIIILSVFGLAVFYDLHRMPDQMTVASLHEKSEKDIALAPDTCMKTLAGNSCLRLSELKGKVVILNFWASWCAPCAIEFPFLLDTVERFKGQIVLVAVSIDTRQDDIKKFRKNLPHQFQDIMNGKSVYWVHDTDQRISQEHFGVYKVPETIIIDKNSRMIRKIIGQVDKASPPLHNVLSTLID